MLEGVIDALRKRPMTSDELLEETRLDRRFKRCFRTIDHRRVLDPVKKGGGVVFTMTDQLAE